MKTELVPNYKFNEACGGVLLPSDASELLILLFTGAECDLGWKFILQLNRGKLGRAQMRCE